LKSYGTFCGSFCFQGRMLLAMFFFIVNLKSSFSEELSSADCAH
jgi:hypothetical protein